MAKGFLLYAMRHQPLLPGATNGDDILFGTNEAQTVSGLAGDDHVFAGGGNDVVCGGQGADFIDGSSGDDLIFGGIGNDTIWGGDGSDVLIGGEGDDNIVTGLGFDEVHDGNGKDMVLLSRQGIVHAAADFGGNTYIASAAGRDGPQTLVYGENERVEINLMEGTVTRVLLRDGNFQDLVYGTDFVAGFNRFVIGESQNNRVEFIGSDSAETLICPGADNHWISMGGGNDVVRVSGRHDSYLVQAYVGGGTGDDLLVGCAGKWSELCGEDGNDRIFGSVLGEDVITQGMGHTISGGAGEDVITAGNITSFMYGDSGNDIIRGRDALDVLDGGEGRDRMSGGGNADQFEFSTIFDSIAADFDTIVDFSTSQGDKLNFSGIDAIEATAEDDTFSLIDRADFSGTAGELRLNVRNGYAMLEADVTGDGAADFAVRLVGVSSLSRADFMDLEGYSGL